MCSEIALRFPTVVEQVAGRAKLSRAHGGSAAVNAPFSPAQVGYLGRAGLKGAAGSANPDDASTATE